MHFDILPTTSEQIPNSTIASERESATPPYLPSRSCRKNGGTRVQLLTDFFTENRLVAQSIRVSSARPSDSFLRQLSKLSLFSPSLCFSSRGPTYLPTWIHTFKMRGRERERDIRVRIFWSFTQRGVLFELLHFDYLNSCARQKGCNHWLHSHPGCYQVSRISREQAEIASAFCFVCSTVTAVLMKLWTQLVNVAASEKRCLGSLTNGCLISCIHYEYLVVTSQSTNRLVSYCKYWSKLRVQSDWKYSNVCVCVCMCCIKIGNFINITMRNDHYWSSLKSIPIDVSIHFK